MKNRKPMPPTKTRRRKIKRQKTLILAVCGLIIVAGLFLLPYIINYYFSPNELIRNTTLAIENLTGSKIQIGSASLSLIDGVTFTDVRVRVPKEKLKLEPAFQPEDGLLLKAESFHIKLRRKGILGLKLQLGAITVINPEFHLAKIAPKMKWNWQMLFAGSATGPTRKRTFFLGPPITLQNGKITLIEIKDQNRTTLSNLHFTAEALPQDKVYNLCLKTWTDRVNGPSICIDINPKTGEILAGKLEAIELVDIERTIPEPFKAYFTRFKLAGKIGISEIEYKPEERSRLVLNLENVTARVPLSAAELKHPQGKTLFQFTHLSGRIVFTDKMVIIPDLTGKLNSAPCHINGMVQGYSSEPNQLGLALHVVCKSLPLLDYTDPVQKDYIETYVHWKLACFFRDFKPKGKLDLDLQLSKPVGPNAALTLAGVVQPRGLSAEYYKFPYRLENLTGTLQLAKGGFKLIDLAGNSEGGKGIINGTISDPTKLAEIRLDITSVRIPLDNKLFKALSPGYREIGKKFNLTGFADSRVKLYQPHGLNQPWHRKISVSLSNGSGAYEGFKYPLKDLTGKLTFENDRLEIRDLFGRNKQAEVKISGTVLHLDEGKPSLDLTLAARNISLDNDLAVLLPNPPAQILRDCRLSGLTDLAGTLKTAPNKPFDFNFLCDLKNAGMCYKDFPYPVQNLSGKLQVRPDKVVINAFEASHGLQTLHGSGTLFFSKLQNGITLKIDAKNLNVDSQIYNALSPAQKETWNLIRPSGRIDVRTELEKNKDKPWDWKMEITLLKSGFHYNSLPDITDVTGKIRLTPRQALLQNISGKVGPQAPLEIDGTVTAGKSNRLQLKKFNVENLPVTDGLLSLFGTSGILKELNWTPGGTLSARLNTLQAAFAPDKKQSWTLEGSLAFKDARVAAFDPLPTSFDYEGALSWTKPGSDFSAAGNLQILSFNYNDRKIKNLKATLNKPPTSSTLTLDHLKGNYADGQISGLCKMQFQPKQTTYGLQLILDNLDAATALKLDTQKKSIQGKMRGEIYMQGTLGQKYIRLGGGTLEITGAEALKIPLMAHIYENASREPPNLASFHNITLEFVLEQHQVSFQEIRLTGPTLSLIGSGAVNLSNDRIALNLITATPKSVPVIQDILQGAAREITQMEVHGTLDNPTISAQPMKDISETLKTFLEGKKVQ
jgi:hypothetical protein